MTNFILKQKSLTSHCTSELNYTKIVCFVFIKSYSQVISLTEHGARGIPQQSIINIFVLDLVQNLLSLSTPRSDGHFEYQTNKRL